MDRRDGSLYMCHLLRKLKVINQEGYDALEDYFKGWTRKSNFMKNVVTEKLKRVP